MAEARAQPLSSREPVPEVGSVSASLPELHCLALLCGPSSGAPAVSRYLGLACGTHTHTHTHTHARAHTPPLHPGGHLWIMQENQSLPDPTPCFPESGAPHLSFPVESTSGRGGPAGLGRWGAAGRLEGLWPRSWLCCRFQSRPSHPGSSITG